MLLKTKIDYQGKFTSVVFECLHKAACTVCCMIECFSVCVCVCVCEVKICARARDYSGGISALCFFSIQYTFVVDLFGFFFFFFSFCLSKIYSDVNCY